MDDYNERCIGETMEVLCEGYDPDEESYYGRTLRRFARISTGRSGSRRSRHVKTGDFVRVRIVDAYDGELVAMCWRMIYNDDCE